MRTPPIRPHVTVPAALCLVASTCTAWTTAVLAITESGPHWVWVALCIGTGLLLVFGYLVAILRPES